MTRFTPGPTYSSPKSSCSKGGSSELLGVSASGLASPSEYARGVHMSVERIPAAGSYALRHAVLRPNQDFDSVLWPGDEESGTATFGAIEETAGTVVGVATVFREPAPFDPVVVGVAGAVPELESATWRLRGMATRQDLQGRGIGTMVLGAALSHVVAEGGRLLWCNARVGAIGFYERAGFSTFGDEWELPTVGPHVVMWRWTEPEAVT